MIASVLIQGVLIGLFTCAPLGPIGVIAAQRTLTGGRAAGISSLLGATTADAVICSLVGLGIHAVSTAVNQQKAFMQVAGGLILVAVGVRIFLARPRRAASCHPVRGFLGAFLSTFLLVLANPIPFLVFAATFTAFGIQGWGTDPVPTLSLVMGVFLGSAAWTPVLATGVKLFGPRPNPRRMRLLNRMFGGLIAVIGIALGLTAWLP